MFQKKKSKKRLTQRRQLVHRSALQLRAQDPDTGGWGRFWIRIRLLVPSDRLKLLSRPRRIRLQREPVSCNCKPFLVLLGSRRLLEFARLALPPAHACSLERLQKSQRRRHPSKDPQRQRPRVMLRSPTAARACARALQLITILPRPESARSSRPRHPAMKRSHA